MTARPRVALVFCVHHKPWLMMATLITLLAQDYAEAEIVLLYNVGSGTRRHGDAVRRNAQLSPFDERVREVCRITGRTVRIVEYGNDEALDSGAWLKFIRDAHWRDYDWVLFGGEGALFARPTTLSSILTFLEAHPEVQAISSAHEQRRLPRDLVLGAYERGPQVTDDDRLHDAMIRRTFDVFRRDPEFDRVFTAWPDGFAPRTRNHVPPEALPSPWLHRLRSAWVRRVGAPEQGGAWAQLPWRVEYWLTRAHLVHPGSPTMPFVHVDGVRRPLTEVATACEVRGTRFHQDSEPGWFACGGPHLMSRLYLQRLTERLEAYGMYEVLDLPFAGTALEVIWGFAPAWLRLSRWFTDGFHRVRKDFVTYRREDYPPDMATYINRYYRGTLVVDWDGDYLRIRSCAPAVRHLRDELPPIYFHG